MQIQLSKDDLGKQKFLGGAFSKLLESLQSNIFTPVATLVPTTGYAEFISNLPFWATRRLECMPLMWTYRIF